MWASLRVGAQQDTVVMRIGGKPVSRSEFRLAYDWNVGNHARNERKSLKNFARQYADCRLQVAAAEAAGLDTTAAFRYRMDSLRRRLSAVCLGGRQLEDSVARLLYEKLRQQGQRIRVSHIFRKLPQNVTAASLHRAECLMDSIYRELQKPGASFLQFVDLYSDEKEPFWLGRLQATAEFESVAQKLEPGTFSEPFYTPQGIHIVKVLEKSEIAPFPEVKGKLIRDGVCRPVLRQSVGTLVEQLKQEYGFKADEAGVRDLLSHGETSRVLFSLAGQEYDGADFARFAQAHPGGTKRQWEAFVQKTVLDCGYAQLGQHNAEFRIRMQACRDTLLCRAVRSRELEMRGESDKVGLQAFFAAHRADYDWKQPRYRGIVLHCVSKRVGKRVRKFLKQIPENEWQDAIRLSVNTADSVQVQAEYGLFAMGENAFVDEKIFHNGKAAPVASLPVTLLLGKKVKGPDDYREAGNALVADYRRYLEKGWMAELRAKSKVEINQEVLKTVNNH